ncbi:MAG: hypothetical protein DHS20C18_48260 [Saprospiraceae bacterium]|nr:MAG: hypothetical protein DHS20C18_48260 [Saprospiraceae bacterium]
MVNKVLAILNRSNPAQQLYYCFAAITLLAIFIGIAGEWYFLAGIPAFLILIYISIVDFRKVFYLLLACIPLSMEYYLPNGFGTDLPTEPLMVGLMLIALLYGANRLNSLNVQFLRHPITLLLLLHLSWIYTTTITSELLFVSVKFSLAKTWYIVVFYFLAGHLIKTEKDIRTVFWLILIPLVLTVAVILVRHSSYGFAFQSVNAVLFPFQRNHVNYAATLTLFFPWMWLARSWYRPYSLKWWVIVGSTAIILVAIYLTFTRAAYVALLLSAIAFLVFHFRLIKLVLGGALLAAVLGIGMMINNNTYLEYAPNYDRTITHESFDNLIEATYKMEDISTMERVYRWVAGFNMSSDNPIMGFGPGNFVNFYKSYTVTSFQTYVSDNVDQSGIHSYFLMTLVEQGIVGLLLFFALSFYVLIRGERIYHQTKNPDRKRLVMIMLLCTIVIDAFLLINDMIETDKVGSFFFMCMAILVNLDLANQKVGPQT